jgi:lysozyme family protein
MKDMPVGVAKAIYRKLYWDAVKADELPAAIRYAAFDAAVNSGVRQATLWLQRAVGVKDDGIIGPKTLEAAKMSNSHAANARMVGMRLDFMTRLNTWDSFGKGWARRIASLLIEK